MFASTVLSAWTVSSDVVINRDGIEYVQAARALGGDSETQPESLHRWIAYPVLIWLTHALSGATYESSAHVVDAVLNALLVGAFLIVILGIGADRSTLLLGAAIVLLFPGITGSRASIGPDTGYALFYLLALASLVRHQQSLGSRNVLIASGCMFLAALFGIEALGVLLVLAPLVTASLYPGRYRWLALTASAGVASVGTVLMAGWWAAAGGTAAMAADPVAAISGGLRQIVDSVSGRLAVIEHDVLDQQSDHHAYMMLAFAACTMLFAEIITRVSVANIAVIALAIYRRRLDWVPSLFGHWLRIVGLNAGLFVAAALPGLAPPAGYSRALALTLLLAAPFALRALYDDPGPGSGSGSPRRFVVFAMVIAVIITGVHGLRPSRGELHLKEAGLWLRGQMSASSRAYVDDELVAYYSGRDIDAQPYVANPNTLIRVIYAEWRQNDYLVLRVKSNSRGRRRLISGYLHKQPTAEFGDGKGDFVMIYATKD